MHKFKYKIPYCSRVLVKFKVGNFASFGNIEEFSMVAGHYGAEKNRTYGSSLQYPILRSSYLYGKNASGKSNFIRAMIYSRGAIIGIDPSNKNISRDFKYRLSTDYSHRDSTGTITKNDSYFEYYIKTDRGLFSYGFEITTSSRVVMSEWLVKINDDETEEILFERDLIGFTTFPENEQTLYDAGLNLESTELFLKRGFETNSGNENSALYPIISELYTWFRDCFIIRTNDSYLTGMIVKKDVIQQINNDILGYDTGITLLDPVELRPFPKSTVEKEWESKKISISSLKDDECFITVLSNRLIQITTDDDSFHFKELMFEHNHRFKQMYRDESDGTKRLLLFLFLLNDQTRMNDSGDMTDKIRTVVIDEIDRSMHTGMTKKIITDYIANKSTEMCQLIATTHECDVLPQLRPDEIWFIDKNDDGETVLYSLEEFKSATREMRDEMYLEGRFGAIPRVCPIERS